jgi:2-methylisocitrate lyase-like PEP mutase family enzyme
MNTPTLSNQSPGNRLRQAVLSRDITPFIGVYDVFSATLAGQHFDALFISGFGFAASFYGLPDIGIHHLVGHSFLCAAYPDRAPRAPPPGGHR